MMPTETQGGVHSINEADERPGVLPRDGTDGARS